MKRRNKIKRVGHDFDLFVNNLQDNMEPILGRRPSYSEVTNSLGNYLERERAVERLLKRTKFNKRRMPRSWFD